MTANAYFRAPFEAARSLLSGRNATPGLTLFLVRARFVGPAIRLVTADSRNIYLGNDGCWQSFDNTSPFETREAAEVAADKIRRRVRITGNRTVSVSVVSLQAGKKR